MKKEVFEEITNKLNLEKNKWILLDEIDSIVTTSGYGVYPDWKHLRFFLTSDEIFIQHGLSKPYGAILSRQFQLGVGYNSISFHPSSVIRPTEYYGTFRFPKTGDILVSTEGKDKFQSEAIVTQVLAYSNLVTVVLSSPIRINERSTLSFYDPSEYKLDECIHGTEVEGIYMKFSPNSGKRSKICGVFHETIKIKNIKEINLKLNTPYKVYKLE